MAQVILLNSIVSKKSQGWSRYLGPYPLATLSSQKLNKSTVVIDHFTDIPNFFEYLEDFVSEKTEWVGISATFLVDYTSSNVSSMNFWADSQHEIVKWFIDLRSLLNKKKSSAKILVGGHCVDTFFKKYALQQDEPPQVLEHIDYLIHGYGENSFEQLILDQSNPKEIHTVGNTKFISNPAVAGDGAILVETEFTKNMAIQPGEWLPIEISKGCRFNCKFCFYDQRGAITKSSEVIKQEFLRNYEYFGTTGYIFSDDTINDSRKKVESLHNIVCSLPFKLEWIAYARPDMFYANPDSADAFSEMGVRGLFLGIETLSKKAGMLCGKGLDPHKIKATISQLKQKLGESCFLLGSFIIGLVGETEESLDMTLEYLSQQKDLDQIQYEILFVRNADSRINSDMSTHPQKYGFKNITFYPNYSWEHETMTYHLCQNIVSKWENRLENHPFSALVSHHKQNSDFWSYPVYRSLGFTHSETVQCLKSKTDNVNFLDKYNNFISNYHESLRKIWSENVS